MSFVSLCLVCGVVRVSCVCVVAFVMLCCCSVVVVCVFVICDCCVVGVLFNACLFQSFTVNDMFFLC